MARIQIRIEIFVKNYSNIQIIRIFVTTPTCTCPPPRWPATGTGSTWPRPPVSWWTVGSTWRERGVSYVYITLKSPSSSHLQVLLQSCHEPYLAKFVKARRIITSSAERSEMNMFIYFYRRKNPSSDWCFQSTWWFKYSLTCSMGCPLSSVYIRRF